MLTHGGLDQVKSNQGLLGKFRCCKWSPVSSDIDFVSVTSSHVLWSWTFGKGFFSPSETDIKQWGSLVSYRKPQTDASVCGVLLARKTKSFPLLIFSGVSLMSSSFFHNNLPGEISFTLNMCCFWPRGLHDVLSLSSAVSVEWK